MSALQVLFVDTVGIIATWDDYCEMLDGVTACECGRELPSECSESFKYGYAQAYARGESYEVNH